eukprot:2953886-Karenia_brevis.AAC.1
MDVTKKSEGKKTNRVNTIWGYGSPLNRSDRGPFSKTPDLCPHPWSKMMSRGGRNDSMWWTCLDCGSRWTRVPMTVGVNGVKPSN